MLSKKRILLSLTMTIVLLFSIFASAFAGDTSVDFDKTGSITVALQDSSSNNTTISGVRLTLYKIANISIENSNLRYSFTAEFTNSGGGLEDMDTQGLAEHLANYANKNKISGMTQKVLDNGSITFDDLSLGLYLVVQEGSESSYYPINPFLVSLPMSNEENADWIYNVEANPKVQLKSDRPDDFITEEPSNQTLIQTGQLNWPIPVLAAAGIILFLLGWTLTFLSRKKNYET